MSEEQKDTVSKKEKDKSEKLIYVLTGLLVVVIFGAIAVLYFNPSTDEKVYKPEKIQVAVERKNNNQQENIVKNINSNLREEEEVKSKFKDNKVKTVENKSIYSSNQTVNNLAKIDTNTSIEKIIEGKNKSDKTSEEKYLNKENKPLAKNLSEDNVKTENKNDDKSLNKSSESREISKKENLKKMKITEVEKKTAQLSQTPKKKDISKAIKNPTKDKKLQKKYYYIQVGALASMEKARKEKAKFERKGFKNIVVIKEKGLYKLLIGRFNSLKEAMEYKRKHNLREGWVRILKNPVD